MTTGHLVGVWLPALCLLNGKAVHGKVACSAYKPGDYSYQACGAFCDEAEKGNHCKYCKCKDCGFCKSTASSSFEEESAKPTTSAPSNLARKNATKRKRRKGTSSEVAAAAPPLKPKASQPSESAAAGAKHKTCRSGIKGDYMYETCGAFCKEAKKGNHCKFCKCGLRSSSCRAGNLTVFRPVSCRCKECSFCGGSAAPKQTNGAAQAPAQLSSQSAAAVAPVQLPVSSGALPGAVSAATLPAQAADAKRPPTYSTAGLNAAHSFSLGLLCAGLVVVCGLVRAPTTRLSSP